MNNIEKVLHEFVDSGKIVGASILIAQHGKVTFEKQAGFADREAKKPVTENTLFRLASMTKPITSAAAMALVEKGVIGLDTPITEWLQNFTPKSPDGTVGKITVRHLLTHTSGLSYGFVSPDNEPYYSAGVSDGLDESVLSLEENLNRLAKIPLLFTPGTNWNYSLSTDVLGGVLEKACGKSLDKIIAEYITEPLGMKNTVFYLDDLSQLSKAYADDPSGTPHLMKKLEKVQVPEIGCVYYAPCRIANRQAYASGGAGMTGTPRDYLKFLEAIRKGGTPILSEASVKAMTHDAVPGFEINTSGDGIGLGLGFGVVRDSALANTPRNTGSFFWAGAYGGEIFVDPSQGISAMIFCNTVLDEYIKFAPKMIEAIYKDV